MFFILSLSFIFNQMIGFWCGMAAMTFFFLQKNQLSPKMVFFVFIQEVSLVLFFSGAMFQGWAACWPLLMKVACPPFHFWVFEFLSLLSTHSLAVFLALMKFIPMMFLLILCPTIMLLFSALFWVLLSFIFLEKLDVIFFVSGNFSMILFLFLSRFAYFLSFFFVSLYLSLVYLFLTVNIGPILSWNSIYLLIIMGLPLGFVFFIKMCFLSQNLFYPLVLALFLSFILPALSYLKMFFNKMTLHNPLLPGMMLYSVVWWI